MRVYNHRYQVPIMIMMIYKDNNIHAFLLSNFGILTQVAGRVKVRKVGPTGVHVRYPWFIPWWGCAQEGVMDLNCKDFRISWSFWSILKEGGVFLKRFWAKKREVNLDLTSQSVGLHSEFSTIQKVRFVEETSKAGKGFVSHRWNKSWSEPLEVLIWYLNWFTRNETHEFEVQKSQKKEEAAFATWFLVSHNFTKTQKDSSCTKMDTWIRTNQLSHLESK